MKPRSYQGASIDAVSAKQIFKTAYAAELITDEQVWLNMLSSHNVTSHVYDDAVVQAIQSSCIAPLSALAIFYRNTTL